MNTPQPGILLPLPSHARYLSFDVANRDGIANCLRALRDLADGENTVVGFGSPLALVLNVDIPGLKRFPLMTAPGLSIESAPEALWIWLRGEDRGEIAKLEQTHQTTWSDPCRAANDTNAPEHQVLRSREYRPLFL